MPSSTVVAARIALLTLAVAGGAAAGCAAAPEASGPRPVHSKQLIEADLDETPPPADAAPDTLRTPEQIADDRARCRSHGTCDTCTDDPSCVFCGDDLKCVATADYDTYMCLGWTVFPFECWAFPPADDSTPAPATDPTPPATTPPTTPTPPVDLVAVEIAAFERARPAFGHCFSCHAGTRATWQRARDALNMTAYPMTGTAATRAGRAVRRILGEVDAPAQDHVGRGAAAAVAGDERTAMLGWADAFDAAHLTPAP